MGALISERRGKIPQAQRRATAKSQSRESPKDAGWPPPHSPPAAAKEAARPFARTRHSKSRSESILGKHSFEANYIICGPCQAIMKANYRDQLPCKQATACPVELKFEEALSFPQRNHQKEPMDKELPLLNLSLHQQATNCREGRLPL